MGIAPAGDWDARAAIQAVLGGAPELRRHIVLADLALRLARLGHVKSVRVDIAGGPEAAKAVRSVLSQLATPPQAAADLDVAAEAVIPLADRSDAVPGPTHALVSVQKRAKATLTGVASGAQVTLPDVARECGFCGTSFLVNPRHAAAHRFCSAACRSKDRHRRAKGIAPLGTRRSYRGKPLEERIDRVRTEGA